MARCLEHSWDDRRHSLLSMLRQRVFGILAGYEDCNDHDILRDDPIFKLIADRRPDAKPLTSQPTLSRFENSVLEADDDLLRVVNALRKGQPDIAIHVRGDAGFGVPLMDDVCEQNGLIRIRINPCARNPA